MGEDAAEILGIDPDSVVRDSHLNEFAVAVDPRKAG